MIEVIDKIGMLFVVFLVTMNLMASFMLMEAGRRYLNNRDRREEHEARMRFQRDNPLRQVKA
ncbi:hypothetical protein [Neoaquamicrobium sediminum]|uniref:hypothetical protein n=1 Tax=Neoaquamicrobium sediminum TaxID=1849104 RepID=UPI0015661643|nr:hypothetical protein [Mesorhizobium sediminum]NRC54167.1 hypothetical protein [Mesorhizobium sediminum]